MMTHVCNAIVFVIRQRRTQECRTAAVLQTSVHQLIKENFCLNQTGVSNSILKTQSQLSSQSKTLSFESH